MLAALEAEKARLQRAREAEAAGAREEAEGRAAAATAAGMEEAEAKLQRVTPPGGSRVETLRKLFEGDASSKMKLDLEEDDTGSSGDSEAGSDPRGHLWVTWGVYLCAGKPPLADIILPQPPDLT